MIQPSPQADQLVLLLGENSLQDSLLVGTIRRQARTRCQLATLDNWRALLTGCDHYLSSPLLLVDVNCLESRQLDDLLLDLGQYSRSVQLALLNVKYNDWPEDRVRWSPVNGLFYQNSSRRLLIRGIKTLLSGEYWLPRRLMQQLLDDIRQPLQSAAIMGIHLTPREHQLLLLMVRGGSNQTIAEGLHLSPHTVKTHVYNLYRKLGVRNRVEAVNWARRHQLS